MEYPSLWGGIKFLQVVSDHIIQKRPTWQSALNLTVIIYSSYSYYEMMVSKISAKNQSTHRKQLYCILENCLVYNKWKPTGYIIPSHIH